MIGYMIAVLVLYTACYGMLSTLRAPLAIASFFFLSLFMEFHSACHRISSVRPFGCTLSHVTRTNNVYTASIPLCIPSIMEALLYVITYINLGGFL